ncbi:MAG: F0F1 ATP synthase subunit delta [candidate division Zixibacteria bacterium]|nr:F0F1 ATP synthase subunit delta [candidate division Zixibacteria bacterium]
MIDTRVAKKYGHALFDIARRDDTILPIWKELSALRDALEKDKRFLEIMAAPQIPDDDKDRLARAVLKNAAHPVVRNFVLFLVDKRRTDYLLDIIHDYSVQLDEHLGVVEAKIISAVPLTDSELKDIIDRLERMTQKTIRHKTVVDPDILGGVVVIVGNEIIDHSVRHDLSRLRDQLMTLKVHLAA